MRLTAFIMLLLLLAAAPVSAAPAVSERTAQAGEPVGERWPDRWQGRQHWLYDDAEPGAATDGFAANARADCRNVPVRMKAPDGSTVVRRIKRCD